MKVFINKLGHMERKLIDVDVVKENARTILVRLPQGRIIKRKIKRDVPSE
jgi:hypothetical protein